MEGVEKGTQQLKLSKQAYVLACSDGYRLILTKIGVYLLMSLGNSF